jgi:hypothetical protein
MIDESRLIGSLTNDMIPIVKVLIAGVIAMWVKDFLSSAAKGIAFFMNRSFGEGDKVKIDDSDAIIVKIGLTQTVFSIINDDGDYVWRYVPNEMIHLLKLEKVIYDAESINNKKSIEQNVGLINNNKKNLQSHIEGRYENP